MKSFGFLILIMLGTRPAGGGSAKGKFLSFNDIHIKTLTSLSVRVLTSTLTFPFCTFFTLTQTIVSPCFLLIPPRRRRRRDFNLAYPKIEDLSDSSTLENSKRTDLDSSIWGNEDTEVQGRFLKRSKSIWTNFVTSTVTSVSLVSSTTLTTITNFVITRTVIDSIIVAGVDDENPGGIPRCS